MFIVAGKLIPSKTFVISNFSFAVRSLRHHLVGAGDRRVLFCCHLQGHRKFFTNYLYFCLMFPLKAKEEAQNFLKSTIRDYKSSAKESDGANLMWNQLMARMECCGVNSYNDFETSSFWAANKGSRVAPEACCILSDKTLLTPVDNNCAYSPTDKNSFYMKVKK